MIKTFDAIVIGAGQAGPSLAGRLTGAGMSVALIERKLIGGTCVNTGARRRNAHRQCITAHMARRADKAAITEAVGVDMKR
jgi:pyruvate/2-oxoglutarate dehydrogenase complex dihydrolipoamide dehydrogenase (E3) component